MSKYPLSARALTVLKARWILPMSSPPLQHRSIIISGNTIENIVPEDQLSQFIAGREYILHDHGNAIILPGFINLHTHLEHTSLRALAKESAFFDWLPRLMEITAGWSTENRVNSAISGVKESIAAGTTFVVDFSYNGASIMPLAQLGMRAVIGLETFGVDESAAEQRWQHWLEHRNTFMAKPSVQTALQQQRIAITVAPHAPYTVCPALWRKAKIWSKEHNLPLLTHLAESKEEFKWFHSEDTDLKQFLIYAFSKRIPNFAEVYETDTAWKGSNHSPVEHLHKHGLLADNLLAAHCVQINDFDIDLLKIANVSIAHCPNSNVTLKCGRAPLEKLLANHVRVGLGTDSAASSNNLNLLNEAAFALKLHRSYLANFELAAKQALDLITIKAAQCLGLEDKLGSLQAGKLADIAVFALPKNTKTLEFESGGDLYSLLIQGLCRLERLLIDGSTVYSDKQGIVSN